MSNLQVIFGGSFDPFHNGHLQMLKQCVNQLQPNYLRLLPCFQQALKIHQAVDSEHRLNMLTKIADEQNHLNTEIIVDDFEIKQGDKNYSIDTLKHFAKAYPQDHFVFLMGEDSILNIQKWKQWDEILNYCHVAVVKRKDTKRKVNQTDQNNGSLAKKIPKVWQSKFLDSQTFNEKIKNNKAGYISQIEMDYVDISSSFIREQSQDRQSYLPKSILTYIQNHHLYGA